MKNTSKEAMSEPRYQGFATFMRTPARTDPSGLDVAIAGIAYDAMVTNRSGARHGPRALRDASSMMRAIHHVTRVDPYAIAAIADLGDVPLTSAFDAGRSRDEITAFYERIIAAGALPLTAGGDHSITYPILRAVAAARPVALIQVDAHTDTWDEFQGNRYMHGTPFRRASEDELIVPEKTVQIGIRGAQNTPEGWDYSQSSGMRVMFMEEVAERGIEAVIEETRTIVGDTPVYVSFDIDSIDPAFAPGTGTPEIGGLTTREAQQLVRGLRGLNLVGADLVEVSPPFDPAGTTALAGATLMYELLCLLAEAASDR